MKKVVQTTLNGQSVMQYGRRSREVEIWRGNRKVQIDEFITAYVHSLSLSQPQLSTHCPRRGPLPQSARWSLPCRRPPRLRVVPKIIKHKEVEELVWELDVEGVKKTRLEIKPSPWKKKHPWEVQRAGLTNSCNYSFISIYFLIWQFACLVLKATEKYSWKQQQ
jgi:hypothetical protein